MTHKVDFGLASLRGAELADLDVRSCQLCAQLLDLVALRVPRLQQLHGQGGVR